MTLSNQHINRLLDRHVFLTDGGLETDLISAITMTHADTGHAPACYMINCAHPEYFRHRLSGGQGWRVRVRANASRLSHAELDACEHLDDGNPAELAGQMAALRAMLPGLRVLGGCCGTDHRHIARIAETFQPEACQ